MSNFESRGGAIALGVGLPLAHDSANGWNLIQSLPTLVKQNLKMILLTNPGERVMMPLFGVGMQQFLFRRFDSTVYSEIDFKIREQVTRHLPSVRIDNITFNAGEQDFSKLAMAIEYSIPNINVRDILEFTL
jgi:hypothetical protein